MKERLVKRRKSTLQRPPVVPDRWKGRLMGPEKSNTSKPANIVNGSHTYMLGIMCVERGIILNPEAGPDIRMSDEALLKAFELCAWHPGGHTYVFRDNGEPVPEKPIKRLDLKSRLRTHGLCIACQDRVVREFQKEVENEGNG